MARTRLSKKAARYAVPVTVASVAVASIGLVPALADNGDPDLPEITAEELIAKIADSDTQQLSGTVQIKTDLGLPALPGGLQGGGGDGGDGADPQAKLMELASGEHTLRVAVDGPEKQRVSVAEGAEEYSYIHNGGEVWAHDSASKSAYHATAPEGEKRGKGADAHEGLGKATPQEAAREALDAVDDTTSVTVDGTTKVAGRDAYQLALKPKKAANSTIEAIRIAVDADNGVPLKLTVAPRGGGKAAIEAGYTKVDFTKPTAGTFDFKPPKGTEITEAEELGKPDHGGDLGELDGLNIIGEGWNSVVELKAPEGADAGERPGSAKGDKLLDAFSEKAEGDFGTGRIFSTRLVNALLTEDGTVYAGAVTKDGLIAAANAN
ncbi:LolA family protein [Streptomyces gobiensis]|uniref:LolA family protein n=1 Tax=Streptomyces gobiensis TaxID=2875706 RepID=UPI001E40D7DD|nr:DUF2092 domain-containing protein [Streptomyces gobiensis]UGY92985.1 DUF2092 domain-containing protein [Streptomyces gobiensis]